MGEFNQWFIKSRPAFFIGVWMLWFLSPIIIIANLQALRIELGIPSDVMRVVNLLYAVVWPLGVVGFTILVIVGLKFAPGVSGDASAEQLDYERRRRSSSKNAI